MLIYDKNEYRVIRTNTLRCSCYIVSYNEKNVLIDTSVKAESKAIVKSLKKYKIDKLEAIFLTHSHTDHAGNARYLSDSYNCSVFIYEKGLNNIKNGICSIPNGVNFLGKAICFLSNRSPFNNFTEFDACEKAEALTDDTVKSYLGTDAKLAYTPGHTQDSVSIIIDSKIVIMGDCAVNFFGNKYPPFADDEKLLKNTWGELIKINAELYCPSHGKPFGYSEFKKANERLIKYK